MRASLRAGTASEPICCRANVADWLKNLRSSLSASIRAGTAVLASGPISPRVSAARLRTPLSCELNATISFCISGGIGLISEMISKFSQCIISGRDSMLIALLITAVSGCIVRGHHTFMVGFDLDTRSYLTFSTSIIAIPTGIKILN